MGELCDSFFDNIQVVTHQQTFKKPAPICMQLEKIFNACNDAQTIKKQEIIKKLSVKPSKASITSFHVSKAPPREPAYMSKQKSTSKSYLQKNQSLVSHQSQCRHESVHQKNPSFQTTTRNDSMYQQRNEIPKTFLNGYKHLKINLDSETFQNWRIKTQSTHQSNATTQRMSLVSLLKKHKSTKREHSIGSICRTIQDEVRQRIASTHRTNPIIEDRIKKSNSVYMDFKKIFNK